MQVTSDRDVSVHPIEEEDPPNTVNCPSMLLSGPALRRREREPPINAEVARPAYVGEAIEVPTEATLL